MTGAVKGESQVKPSFSSVADIEVARFQCISGETVNLVALEGDRDVPFPIARVFYIWGVGRGVVRGRHAHKACKQFFVCLHGACEVHCDDGRKQCTTTLRRPDEGLYVPASIWAAQTYLSPDTVLLVLCDRPYEDQDYIRDYDEFLRYRGVIRA